MGERRAVSQILSDLKERAEESDAGEADGLARATILERKRKAFKKSPDIPLGIVVQKKLAKSRRHSEPNLADASRVQLNLHSEGVFDTPYSSILHKRIILRELKYHTGIPRWTRHKKKTRRFGRYEREAAARWREAILRDAPLLKGFLAQEPQWREKIPLWCERALTASLESD
jgi:hypothetical protein